MAKEKKGLTAEEPAQVDAPSVPAQVEPPKEAPKAEKKPEPAQVAVPKVDPLVLLTRKFDALCKLQGIVFKEDAGRMIAVR
jgi:hypothetical protein